jgi:drug/metabolite transporter (DMT)-like permease
VSVTYWILLVLGVLMSSLGGVCLKLGALELNLDGKVLDVLIGVLSNLKIGLGLLLYFVPALIWIFMLRKIDISFLQPLFSLVYVVTPILAVVILKEPMPTIRWVGILVVIFGVSLVAQS